MPEARPVVAVAPVRSKNDWREFHRFRRSVYRNDPAAVMPLTGEERLLLDVHRHPFWQHAEREVFLARRNGSVVGRVAAILDRQHQEYHSDRTGFFGFFECENEPETARALLRAAADWLVERDCDTMRGPVSPSMKGEFGVVVKGHDVPPAIMMAHTPKWYDPLLQSCGLSPIHDFFGYSFDRAGFLARREHWQKLDELCKRLLERHPELEVRAATSADLGETLREVNRLANQVRTPVWGFVPITDAEVDFLIARLRRVMDPDLVVTVRRRGDIVGYIIALPDVNWALARTRGRSDLIRLAQMPFLLRRIRRLRILAVGTDPKARAAGLVPLLFYEIRQKFAARFDDLELSWFSEENLPSIKAVLHVMPAEPDRRYRLYQTALPLH